MSSHARDEYKGKLQTWLENGWLIPYSEGEFGPLIGLLPLMAVVQENKGMVCSMLDYQELTDYVDAYTTHAVYREKLQNLQRKRPKVSILDCQKADL